MKKNKILLPLDSAQAETPWLWLGTWSMGGEGFGPHDERVSREILSVAAESGIRHFDTAGFYGRGKSERLLQQVIKQDRRAFFISSKGGLVWNGRRVEHRAAPEELQSQLRESLERLKTDYIDIYNLHWPDPDVPVSESIGALKTFQEKGLIRYWGIANLAGRELMENLPEGSNIPHQVHFNPVHRSDDILLAGSKRCISCVISPLEQGLLGAGTSRAGVSGIGKKDFRRKNPLFSDSEVLRWNTALHELSEQYRIPKVSAVLMWICCRPSVHAVIPGPRRAEQLTELLAFRDEVLERDLFAGEGSDTILSEEKVRSVVRPELWAHLSQGPENFPAK